MLRRLANERPRRPRVVSCGARGALFEAALASAHALAPGALATLVTLAAPACNDSHRPGEPEGPTSAPAPTAKRAAAPSGPEFVAAPVEGDAAEAVRRAMSAASAAGRRVVVYVGATWCEPCQRFHHAVEAGELTRVEPLAGVTLLEFDLDRDLDRLAAAGYASKYIPLFALPGPDGRSTGKQTEGGIKGDGAVSYMVPRLAALLAP